MSDIRVLERRALEIRRKYDKLDKERYGQPWDAAKLTRGFKKDVSNLLEIVEKRPIDHKKLEHELADCLWSVLVIARKLNIDIEAVFWRTMDDLDLRFEENKA